MANPFARLAEAFGFKRTTTDSIAEANVSREAYIARCHHFKLLLGANNKALEIMSDMEEALKGARPFGMNYIRAQCARVSSNIYQIIKHLNSISGGCYEALHKRFNEIQLNINSIVSIRDSREIGPLVLPLEQVDAASAGEVGGKAANLGEVHGRLGIRIPKGFVVTASGYSRFMEANDLQPEINRRIQTADAGRLDEMFELSSSIQQLIISAPLPEDLEKDILESYRLLEAATARNVKLAMRSSALGEDLLETSFAGQYRSELNVSSESILQAYREVVASKYGVTAMTYRHNRGIPDEDVAMCVACMQMIDAQAGGVAYTRNPLNVRDDSVFINSVAGLPNAIVDGSADSDVFMVSRGERMDIIQREVAVKRTKFICNPDEGVSRVDLPEKLAARPSLNDDQILELAVMAVSIEEHYGLPQDIEWAYDRSGILLLQARPLQQTEDILSSVAETGDQELPETVILAGGVSASPGVGHGQVFIAKKDMDALRFPKGAVLVAAQAQPRWATLMSRAAAVVTEMGSVAGHLANVAREFRTPALFGVPDAMARLENVETVTVDATGRMVHEGFVEGLAEKETEARNLMAGSPVHGALSKVCEHIIPLNLLDPEALEFRPENCITFHDITRFCHEKSVREMFDHGPNFGRSEMGSKQLYCGVPMQYWVIDLEDGFTVEVTGKYVRLEEIASLPMLALWNGMTAIQWAGPPQVEARGFMSVVAGAACNPDLDPARSSAFSVKNYFMISRNFCSLQSRFGFHFCTVEAVVGESAPENYASFQFKGGAASQDRRVARARLVGDILEEYGFRVEIKEDALFARIEGYPHKDMEIRLMILGHLIIHTRQLDMVMSSKGAGERYGTKIRSDLKKVVGL